MVKAKANPQTSSVFATLQLVDGSSVMDIPDREWIIQGTNILRWYPKTRQVAKRESPAPKITGN